MVLLVVYVVLTVESYGVMKLLLFEIFEKSRIIKVKECDLLEADNTNETLISLDVTKSKPY